MSSLVIFLIVMYMLGVCTLILTVAVSLSKEVDKKWVKSFLPFNPRNNITLLLAAVLLISVWPVYLLKPIYNWMKEPC